MMKAIPNKEVFNKSSFFTFVLHFIFFLGLIVLLSFLNINVLKAEGDYLITDSPTASSLIFNEGLAKQKKVMLSPLAPNIESFQKKYNSFFIAEKILNKYLNIPFRVDGALNENGEWVTWQKPNSPFKSPGFNCSGFLLAAHRDLFKSQITFQEAKLDRDNNSAPNSGLGEDWDFGLDLVLNLGQEQKGLSLNNLEKTLITENNVPLGAGVNIHSPQFFQYLEKMKPGFVYYFAISRPDKRFKAGLAYYHVGLILPSFENNLWVYHTTSQGKTYRLDLNSPNGKNRFFTAFPARNYGERRILFLKVPL